MQYHIHFYYTQALCQDLSSLKFSKLFHYIPIFYAQKAHPLVKEDVLFITYVIPFRAILPSMESRGVDSHKKI